MSAGLRRRVARHGLFWAAILAFSLILQLPAHWGNGAQLYVRGLFFNQLPASMLATYPLLYWLLPRLMRQRQTLTFGLLLAAWVAACAPLTMLTVICFDFVVLPGLFHVRPNPAFNQAGYWHLNYTFFITMLTAGIAATIKITREWETQRRQRQQLRQQRLRTELQLLKAQLQPAFLFGTLRTLHGLTARRAPESPGAVLHLAGLLRYQLYDSPRDAVPLPAEAQMLRHYVALEELRHGGRVEVSLSISGRGDEQYVAPLLLLPLVEHAFRQAPTAQADGPAWVSIDLLLRPGALVLKVISGPPAAEPGDDAGLARLRERLARLYPGRHRLALLREPDTLLATLHLQLAAPPDPPDAAQPQPAAVLVTPNA